MRDLTKAEQDEAVRVLRFLLQKLKRYTVSHSGASISSPQARCHDTLLLADAITQAEEFLTPLKEETGWRGFVGRLARRSQ